MGREHIGPLLGTPPCQRALPQWATVFMLASLAIAILPLRSKGLTMPADEVEVGRPGALNDHQLACVYGRHRVFEFMHTLAADIDIMAQGGVRDPGYTTTVIGINGEIEEEIAGQTWPQPPLSPCGVKSTVSRPQVYAHVRDD